MRRPLAIRTAIAIAREARRPSRPLKAWDRISTIVDTAQQLAAVASAFKGIR